MSNGNKTAKPKDGKEKIKRIAKSKDDLKRELTAQLQLLRMSCEAYDRGTEAAGKYIALSLRVLLYQHGRSRSLLEQLGHRSGKFISTGAPLRPGNLATECTLTTMRMSPDGIKWFPLVAAGGGPMAPYMLQFTDWWLEPVVKDSKNRKFTRLDLVQHVANTDGGAHVDPDLDEDYMELSRQNSLGYTFGREQLPPEIGPELACMRQIAHELLSTLHQFVPELSEAARPVQPSSPT